MTKADFYIKQRNVSPALEVQLLANDKSPIGLENARVRFKMEQSTGGSVEFEKPAKIIDKQDGRVAYEWDRDDTAAPGQYRGEFVVDFDGGSPFQTDETFPSKDYLSIIVDESL